MANWYVDTGATGANNGMSQTDAWTSIVFALASSSVVSGDIVWCKGIEVLTANLIQIAQASGIIFRAVNASWISDGTPFVIDGGSTYTIFNWGTSRSNTWEYFTLRRAATGCYYGTATGNNIFIGCLFELNPSCVGSSGGSVIGQFYRCIFQNNVIVGGASLNTSLFDSCVFQNNTTAFTVSGQNNKLVNCHLINNTNGCVSSVHLDNCVIDGNSNIGITSTTGTIVTVSRCRITNNGTGVTTGTNGRVYLIDCVVSDNTTNQTTGSGGSVIIFGDTTIANGLSKYIDRANKNFGLLADAPLRRTAKSTLSNVLTVDYVTAGIQGTDKIYPNFNISPNLGSVDGGTTVTLNFPDGGANLLTGVTFGGTAGTNRTVINDNQATIKTPAKTASQVDVVGSFSGGYADYTITGGFTFVESAAGPEAFTISCQPENYDSIKVNISLSSNAIYYVVYRDGVPVSSSIKSHYFIDPSGPGTFVYKVRAHGEASFIDSNEVTITRDNTGFVDLTSMITFIMKMLLNEQKKVVESGVAYLVTYDDDNVNIICKQPLKTFLGNNVSITENSIIPEQRLRSLIYSVGTINEADLTNLVTMITKEHFFLKKIVERPATSGVKQLALYDADNNTVLHSNRLKTFNGNDLGDLRTSTAPVIREKSIL